MFSGLFAGASHRQLGERERSNVDLAHELVVLDVPVDRRGGHNGEQGGASSDRRDVGQDDVLLGLADRHPLRADVRHDKLQQLRRVLWLSAPLLWLCDVLPGLQLLEESPARAVLEPDLLLVI